MSYSVDSKCSTCVHHEKCVDLAVIQGSVNTIHGINMYSFRIHSTINRGHLGGGTIIINCSNFQQEGVSNVGMDNKLQ
jgi:hypothetical protein